MLFWNRKKEASAVDLSWLGADMHSHLLPAIDDGAQELNTSLQLIKGLAALGFKKLVTTPHVLWEIYPNTAEIITGKLAQLSAAVTAEGINIELAAAAEYFIDEHFEYLLQHKIPLLPLKDNLVLVEFSMVTAPIDLKEVIFNMQLAGYQPVIAHPERYIYLNNKKEFFDDLKDAGCFFQVNLLSLTGHYGNSVQELADYLIKKDYYNYAGTDMHGVKHLDSLQKLGSSSMYVQLKNSGSIKNHLL